MKRILLYGFSGFDRFSRNPSRDVVNALAAGRIAGVKVDKIIFKVAYAHVEQKVPRLLAKAEYDAVIGFGLARGATGIRLEKEAHNLINSKTADTDGIHHNRRKIIRGGPDRYLSSVSLTRLRSALIKEDIPAAVSHDAGGYVCNFTYYHILHQLRSRQSRSRCLFVHIPLSCEIVCRMNGAAASLPQAVLTRAGRVIIGKILQIG
ncbi:MAG: pyroglutamyl-peptidase I [Candidatus Omnitrophica bacterium]|nr:pyroglutamyl-peptidase I [Candidatus Omnitrophota bacterium]MCB9719668.1 pyroglutamyl-peptidase I [Candidatus Omnitrophota bacterium]